ncbi:hypothetical protein E2562_014140 [Oryza meyeriana var. granulata]|uniref:Uncharacterized protein n=1 Tax=Oryza meyeriana var. granulata TaxID=110450 RepID=A0A6G1F8C7_9ORYZ|nr:hypothetical protein E2562_014140 [Oryza meyeriana var. granulata]
MGKGWPGLSTKRQSTIWRRWSLARAKMAASGGRRWCMVAARGDPGEERAREHEGAWKLRGNGEGVAGSLCMPSGDADFEGEGAPADVGVVGLSSCRTPWGDGENGEESGGGGGDSVRADMTRTWEREGAGMAATWEHVAWD